MLYSSDNGTTDRPPRGQESENIMSTIDHGDTLDMRDLAQLGRDALDTFDPEFANIYDDNDRTEARETLDALREFLADVDGIGRPLTDADVVDRVDEIGNDYEPTLIAADHFEDYARQLAEDLGMIPSEDSEWPLRHIDWKEAADELKTDYSTGTLDGREYLIRSY